MFDIRALYQAYTIDEALCLLSEHKGAKIIAGGSDILLKIREGEYSGCELVSIQQVDELRGVKLLDNGDILILPLTSFSHIVKDKIINEHIPSLAHAADMVGGPQIRNIGTIGGNVCNGAVSADTAPTLSSYEARMIIRSRDSMRELPISEFYKGPGRVDLKEGELLTAIIIKKSSYEDTRGHYIKYAMRNAMDIATLNCSANVKRIGGKIERLRICFGVAGPVPTRATNAEAMAQGMSLTNQAIKDIAKKAMSDINPRDSWRASKALRLQIAEQICAQAIAEATRI